MKFEVMLLSATPTSSACTEATTTHYKHRPGWICGHCHQSLQWGHQVWYYMCVFMYGTRLCATPVNGILYDYNIVQLDG